MKTTTQKIVMASLMTAFICVVTMLVKIPSPLKGYVNLGDCPVLIAGWVFSPTYAFLAGALGSALADVFSGYVLYAPATFLIKGVMALLALGVFRFLNKKMGNFTARVLSGALAEVFMVLGYYLFEGILYGFVASAVNIPANAIQGIAGLILGVILIKILEKNKIFS